jgi:LmbE family N-acetylglucosaminyl deacetylase
VQKDEEGLHPAANVGIVSAVAILSPHPDDAVLSLWHVLTGPGDVRVLTIFNGPPEETVELGWWDRLTRAGDAHERAGERAAEDRAALALVGREPVNLGFIDGQYRSGPQDLGALAEAIAAAVPDDSLLLAPASLDNHGDHVATRDAARLLAERGWAVSLYADIPHANLHGWPTWVNGTGEREYLDPEQFWDMVTLGSGIALRELEPQVHSLSDQADARKREAVRRYRTQVEALEAEFGIFVRPEVLRHEIVWQLAGTPTG